MITLYHLPKNHSYYAVGSWLAVVPVLLLLQTVREILYQT